MLYTIIGGDGKEYGSVLGEDLRKWIAEGRLNGQSLAKAESDAEFRPLSTFPELAAAFASPTIAPPAPPAFAGSADFQERDYDLDIGGCVSRGWNLCKNNFGTLIVSFWVAMLIVIVAGGVLGFMLTTLIPKTLMASVPFRMFYNIVIQVVLALVNGPLFGGVFYIFLQTLRGRPAGIGDVFIGFQRAFSQLFLGNFVVAFLVGLCFVPLNIMEAARIEPLIERLQHASPSDIQNVMPDLWSALFGMLPVLGLCMIPMIYLTVNWQFVLPLIIDKPMDFWPAMKASWKMVHKHWFLVFGLTVVVGLINVAGVCACCIGVLFTMPMTTAAMMYAYETIFSRPQTG
jgi:hypothetical protein